MSSYYVRTDSSTANNPAINLTGDPSFQITFVAETPSGDSGDLWLGGGSPDPNTQVQIGGQTYSFSVNWVGTLPTANRDGAGQVPTQFRGEEVIRIAVQDYPAVGEVTYLTFMPNQQATAAEMDAFGNGRISVQNINETPQPIPVCFVEGTRLATVNGDVAVEDLQVGDLVMTRDHGPQPVRWIGSTAHSWPGTDDKLRPIRIPAGSMPGNLPRRDLMVSPQHRILLSQDHFPFVQKAEYLAPAIGLEGYRGIQRDAACRTVRYYHVLLDHHSILLAEGLSCESFFPGPMGIRMLSLGHRIEIVSLFPNLADDPAGGYGPLCRPALTKRQAVDLLSAAAERVNAAPSASPSGA